MIFFLVGMCFGAAVGIFVYALLISGRMCDADAAYWDGFRDGAHEQRVRDINP